MSEKTQIQWCDSTINFWRGCDKVSPGCKHCYITASVPFRISGQKHGDPRVLNEGAFKEALKLNKKPWICNKCGNPTGGKESGGCVSPNSKGDSFCYKCGVAPCHRRRIFSLSLGDWLDDKVPIEWLARMLDTIRQCDQVTWILCSKRLENFWERTRLVNCDECDEDENGKYSSELYHWLESWKLGNAPKNIILLASVENQEMADKRVPELLKIPAACRGLSLEPLLGPVEFAGNKLEWLSPFKETDALLNKTPRVDWLIVGGESDSFEGNARPCNSEWIRSIVAQGAAAGVATFVKQMGSNPEWPESEIWEKVGPPSHKKGGDPSEWPADLRVRQFPEL